MTSQLVDLRSERIVLGAMMLRQGAEEEVSFLSRSDFFDPDHRDIYDAILEMRAHHDPIEYITVHNYLHAHGHKTPIQKVETLTDDGVISAEVVSYARKVKERARAREMDKSLRELVHRLEAGEHSAAIAGELLDVADVDSGGLVRADLQACVDKLSRYQSGTEQGYRLTGVYPVDKYAPGANELVIVAGRPSIGKSALGLYLAERIAARGEPATFCSIEMAGDDCNLRRVGSIARVSVADLRRQNGLSVAAWDRIASAFTSMKKSPLEVVSGRFTLADLVTTIRREKSSRNVKAVVVDHLGCMILPEADRHDLRLGIVTSTLARLAKDQNVTIYLLHQLNRANEQRADRRPMLSDLRNSGEIEQDADCVWLLFRERYYSADAGRKFEISVAKNRNGPTGTIELYFDECTGFFGELSQEDA